MFFFCQVIMLPMSQCCKLLNALPAMSWATCAANIEIHRPNCVATILAHNPPTKNKLCFGGTPNSSITKSSYIIEHKEFDYMDLLFAQWLCPCGQCDHRPVFIQNNHMADRNTLKPSEPCLRNLHQHAPEPSRTCLQNLHQHKPEPSGTCLRKPHQHAPKLSGTCRNCPESSGALVWDPTPTHTGTCRSSPEPSGTFQNLPPEPTSARTGTLRNLTLKRNVNLNQTSQPQKANLKSANLHQTFEPKNALCKSKNVDQSSEPQRIIKGKKLNQTSEPQEVIINKQKPEPNIWTPRTHN